MNNKTANICIAILKYAIKNNCTIAKACSHYKKRPNFISDYKRRGLERDFQNKTISKSLYDEFQNLFSEF